MGKLLDLANKDLEISKIVQKIKMEDMTGTLTIDEALRKAKEIYCRKRNKDGRCNRTFRTSL